jgi:7,8-dihydro-6-hydroxymethylpterin dimethyltransferase
VKERATADHVYYASTRSLCAQCTRPVDARIVFREGGVWLEKHCPDHGDASARVASSAEWYLDALSFSSPARPPEGGTPPARGCPFDCGPCAMHQQRSALPVVPITSACNLDCPVCYTHNRNEAPFAITRDAFAQVLGDLAARGELDIINFTGGEPTLHPELPDLLRMARRAGVQRLTVSTNGLRLVDEALVRELADVDARIVLSLDTFDDAVDRALVGATTVQTKLRALDLLERHGVTTTILPAIAAGYNDRDVGPLFDLVLARPNVCSLELHTVAFTGDRGAAFPRAARITTPDLHRLLDAHSAGAVRASDFVPSPLAHPHCYSICYLLMLDGGGYVPFTRFMPRATLYALLSDALYLEPGPRVEAALRDAIDRLWSESSGEAILATLKRLLKEMFKPGLPLEARRRMAERASKAIYIHSHMDADTFDVSRVIACPITVPSMPGADDRPGGAIPTCAYNAIYRARDPRFRRSAS